MFILKFIHFEEIIIIKARQSAFDVFIIELIDFVTIKLNVLCYLEIDMHTSCRLDFFMNNTFIIQFLLYWTHVWKKIEIYAHF